MDPKGEAVFFNTSSDSWMLGRRSRDGVVTGENGQVYKALREVYHIMDEEGIEAETDDLLKLGELHEGVLLRCVRKRHARDEIYTFIGPAVILSINPWKFTIPAYTADQMPSYIRGDKGVPPHIWSIGKTAYENMMTHSQNQTILVSGESGAGKTEAVKSLLKFLGKMSEAHAAMIQSSEDMIEKGVVKVTDEIDDPPPEPPRGETRSDILQAKIEACNPILETFGNAKTVRNDNSSRFGKFLEVNYDGEGRICGAHTINYLLERSRVVSAGGHERLFHSFYQLMASTDAKTVYGLEGPSHYKSLGDTIRIEGVDDAKDFKDTSHAMRTMGLSEEQVKSVWAVVAGILHLHRVSFQANEDTDETEVVPATAVYLEKAAEVWCVDADTFKRELLCVTVKAGNELVVRKYSPQKATATRDAICKEVYASLFQWLIDQINDTMRPEPGVSASWIGLLDIFGFEHFQHNSLEQLCINLANEMLQNHYNEHIFTADMMECRAEGIETQHVEFQDNKAVVDLIAHNTKGILAHLDDQCKTRPDDNMAFLDRITRDLSKDPAFFRSKLDRDAFRLKHYAADVRYGVANFGEKNLDSVPDGILKVVRASTDPLIAGLAKAEPGSDSVTGIFKKQLRDLINVINLTKPSWIRCIKPHPVKRPRLFEPVSSMAQLASSGVLETVRVRQAGYPVRIPHAVFVNRFRILLPNMRRSGAVDQVAARSVLEALQLPAEKAQVGKTKVFLRSYVHTELEDARNATYARVATVVSMWGRTRVAMRDAFKRKYRSLLELLREQKKVKQAFEADAVEQLAQVAEEETAALPALFAAVAEDERLCFQNWCEADRCRAVEPEEAAARDLLLEESRRLRLLYDNWEKMVLDRNYDGSIPLLYCEEEEEWRSVVLRAEEDRACLMDLLGERTAIANAARAEERRFEESAESFARRMLETGEAEGFGRMACAAGEASARLRELVAQRRAIDQRKAAEETEIVEQAQERELELIRFYEAEAIAAIIIRADESRAASGSITSAWTVLLQDRHQEERERACSWEAASRHVLAGEEDVDSAYAKIVFDEELQTIKHRATATKLWQSIRAEQRDGVSYAEGVQRSRISNEEDAFYDVFVKACEQSRARAFAVQCWRQKNVLETKERHLRADVERECDVSVAVLWERHNDVQTFLYNDFLWGTCTEEARDRQNIARSWDAFHIAAGEAYADNKIDALKEELDRRCWLSRRALELVYRESRAQLEAFVLKHQARAAAVQRSREVSEIRDALDDLDQSLLARPADPFSVPHAHPDDNLGTPNTLAGGPPDHSPPGSPNVRLPDPAYAQHRAYYSPAGSPTKVPRYHTFAEASPLASPPTRRSRLPAASQPPPPPLPPHLRAPKSSCLASPVALSRSLSPNVGPDPGAPDPFTGGTWLWRAMTPSVGKRWTRFFVKLIGGELRWYSGESAEPKVFKLSRVISIEPHDLPDKDGYHAPNCVAPSVARRFSTTAQYGAMKLTIKGEVEGSSTPRNKGMILCAEFPSIAVMWLRRLRQEWSQVCNAATHPHGSPGKNCVPGKGTVDLSPLLSSNEPDAAKLVRDLRKFLRKAKRLGFELPCNTDLRTFTDARLPKPTAEGASREEAAHLHPMSSWPAQSVDHCKIPGCGFARRMVGRTCERHLHSFRPQSLDPADEPDSHANDSDLSEDPDIGTMMKQQRQEFESLLSATEARVTAPSAYRHDAHASRPSAAFTKGHAAQEHWTDVWKKIFGRYALHVTRDTFLSTLERSHEFRQSLASVTMWGTDATDKVTDIVAKRLFFDCGVETIEREEFVLWVTTGSSVKEHVEAGGYVADVFITTQISAVAAAMAVVTLTKVSPSLFANVYYKLSPEWAGQGGGYGLKEVPPPASPPVSDNMASPRTETPPAQRPQPAAGPPAPKAPAPQLSPAAKAAVVAVPAPPPQQASAKPESPAAPPSSPKPAEPTPPAAPAQPAAPPATSPVVPVAPPAPSPPAAASPEAPAAAAAAAAAAAPAAASPAAAPATAPAAPPAAPAASATPPAAPVAADGVEEVECPHCFMTTPSVPRECQECSMNLDATI
ncbi:Myosin-5 [Diplonema papillatum]|nr:Myosin-5 [Diplonema papillatum]